MKRFYGRVVMVFTCVLFIGFVLINDALIERANLDVFKSDSLSWLTLHFERALELAMYVILYLMSIFSVVAAVAAALRLRDTKTWPSPDRRKRIRDVLHGLFTDTRPDARHRLLLQRLDQDGSSDAVTRFLRTAGESDLHSPHALRRRLGEYLREEGLSIETLLTWIELMTSLAPTVGFLGTLVGMAALFETLVLTSAERGGDLDLTGLAGGLKLALMTSVLGLIIKLLAGGLLQGLDSRWQALCRELCLLVEPASEQADPHSAPEPRQVVRDLDAHRR